MLQPTLNLSPPNDQQPFYCIVHSCIACVSNPPMTMQPIPVPEQPRGSHRRLVRLRAAFCFRWKKCLLFGTKHCRGKFSFARWWPRSRQTCSSLPLEGSPGKVPLVPSTRRTGSSSRYVRTQWKGTGMEEGGFKWKGFAFSKCSSFMLNRKESGTASWQHGIVGCLVFVHVHEWAYDV